MLLHLVPRLLPAPAFRAGFRSLPDILRTHSQAMPSLPGDGPCWEPGKHLTISTNAWRFTSPVISRRIADSTRSLPYRSHYPSGRRTRVSSPAFGSEKAGHELSGNRRCAGAGSRHILLGTGLNRYMFRPESKTTVPLRLPYREIGVECDSAGRSIHGYPHPTHSQRAREQAD